MSASRPPTAIHWLDDLTDQCAGGKAMGLNRLLQWGMKVPRGFVIVNATAGSAPDELADYYRQLGGGKVAVRSSAIGEDGDESSFAGLYETRLNVEGLDELKAAIDRCVMSLHGQRASAYQHDQGIDAPQMSVVVQRMVEARAAGVLFTVDPVSGRHDRLIIDAVNGLGEALVSGELTPDHYEFDGAGVLVLGDLIGPEPVLSESMCAELVTQARRAVSVAAKPLDMEWALDADGNVFWLQARPITTVGTDLNELDTPIAAEDVVTRCNVGEMMPGASCPLTFSTTGRAIEYGMQHMHVSYAGRKSITDEWTQIAMSHGRLFLNLSGSLAASASVLGVDGKSLGHSVCGRIVEELKEPPKKSLPVRLMGMLRLLRYLQGADRVIDAFSQRAAGFRLPVSGNSIALASTLDDAQQFFYDAFCVHLQSSTTSGFASNLLQAMISGGQQSTPEEEAEAARLMAGASGVESALLVEQLDQVTRLVALHAGARKEFVDAAPAMALDWLRGGANAEIVRAFDDFLVRHGHRSYRELCLREPCWADDPSALVVSMQASVRARLGGLNPGARMAGVRDHPARRSIAWILAKAHRAIRRREATKSLLVDVTNRLKRTYRALGQALVDEGKLVDVDLVFFFTHDELLRYARESSSDAAGRQLWNDKTRRRRVALEFQDRLDFDDICVGPPVPIEIRNVSGEQDNEIVGRPVSHGVIEATARVANTLADAADLKAGEILVAPITDVGWTPYFSMISGLVTDVGSAVSHGAVIAREYGLPAIVNTRVATQRVRTGDRVRLNADTGVVTIL